jgi:hypothetical protein
MRRPRNEELMFHFLFDWVLPALPFRVWLGVMFLIVATIALFLWLG